VQLNYSGCTFGWFYTVITAPQCTIKQGKI